MVLRLDRSAWPAAGWLASMLMIAGARMVRLIRSRSTISKNDSGSKCSIITERAPW